MHSWKIRIFSTLCTVLVVGCATPVKNNIEVSETQISKYSTLSALEAVEALENNVNAARDSNMEFLAPQYFREATKVLSESQSALGNKPREELARYAAKGDAILEKGRAVMGIVKYRFAQELELKAQLEALNTPKLLPTEYGKVMSDFSGLIDKTERERPVNIDKDKEALLKAMQALEILSVQEGTLHESETINTDSKNKNADKQAPLTFAEAQRVYQDAKKQIAIAPHDQNLVQRLGAEALFAAHHAQQVNERVALLQSQFSISAGSGVSLSGAVGGLSGAQLAIQGNGKSASVEKVTMEKIVLQEESRLQDIAAALGLRDLRDLPLEKQVSEIKSAAAGLAQQSKSMITMVSVQELDARVNAANEATRQALGQLVDKDKQLDEKDAQISTLMEKVSQLEKTVRPAAKAKTAKPKKQ